MGQFMRFTFRKGLFGFLVLALISATAAGCSKAARTSRALAGANRDFAQGNYDKAEIEYLKARQIEPLNRVAIRQLGYIYEAEGRWYPAYIYLSKALSFEPKNAQLLAKFAASAFSLHDVNKAREAALKALSLQPGMQEALLALVDASITPAAIQDSRQQVERIRQADKDRAAYHLALGLLDLRQKQTAKAETELKTALAMEPKSPVANAAIGSLYWQQHELAKADQAFKTAFDLAPWRSPQRLNYVEFKLANQDLEGAKQLLNEMTHKCPDYVPAWNALAQIAFAQKQYSQSSSLDKRLLARDPSNFQGLLLAGNLSLATRKPAQAILQFKKMLTLYTNSFQVDLQLARAYRANRDTANAAATYEAILKRMPGTGEAVLELADLRLAQQHPAQAASLLEQLLKRQPKVVPAQLLLATAYGQERQYDKALDIYRALAETAPNSPQIPFLMGNALLAQGKRQAARQAYARALKLAPDSDPPLEQLVNMDLADRHPDEAIQRVTKEVKRRPEDVQLRLLLAKVFISQKDTRQAQTTLQKLLQLAPQNQQALLMLTELEIASGKQQDALARLTNLVARTNSVPALLQIGVIQESLKNYDAARKAYQRALSLQPDSGIALNNLACLDADHLNDLSTAYTLAQRARQVLPDDPHSADTLGWILYKRASFVRALPLLQQAATAMNSDPVVAYHLGMAAYMTGDEQLARLNLQKALAAKADFHGKTEAQQSLDCLAIAPATATPANLETLEKRVAQVPNDVVALDRLGQLYERNHSLEQAAATYESLLKLQNQNTSVMLRLARLYAGPLNQPKRAMKLAADAHNISGDNPEISALLGHLALQKGDFTWAHTLLSDASQNLPETPALLYDLASASFGIGHLSEAQASLTKLLASAKPFDHRPDAKNLADMIAAYEHPDHAQQTASQVSQLLQANPDYIPALVVSAVLDQQHGDPQQARKTYERILLLNPRFTPAARDLAILFANQHWDLTKGYDLAINAHSVFPDDPLLTRALGILMFERHDYAGAARMLSDSLAKGADESALQKDPLLRYYLGMANYNLGQSAESRQALQKALALNLPSPYASTARATLAKLE